MRCIACNKPIPDKDLTLDPDMCKKCLSTIETHNQKFLDRYYATTDDFLPESFEGNDNE